MKKLTELAQSRKPEKRIDALRLLDSHYRRDHRSFRPREEGDEPEFVQMTITLPQSLFDRMTGTIEREKMFRQGGDRPRRFEQSTEEFIRWGIELALFDAERDHTIPSGVLESLSAIRAIPDFEERIRILKSNDPSESVVAALDGMARRRQAEVARSDASYWKRFGK